MQLPSLQDVGKFVGSVIKNAGNAASDSVSADLNAQADRLAQARVAQNAGNSISNNLPVLLLGGIVIVLLLRRK